MIQRIQSLYLVAVAVLAGLITNVLSLYTANSQSIFASTLLTNSSLLEKLVPFGFYSSALLALISIFLFKNRQLQFVLGRVNLLINLFLVGLLLYLLLTLSGETTVSEKGIGVFIPLVNIVLLTLANKAIKRDEDLVKSVDRLR